MHLLSREAIKLGRMCTGAFSGVFFLSFRSKRRVIYPNSIYFFFFLMIATHFTYFNDTSGIFRYVLRAPERPIIPEIPTN